jgi:NADH-quinone oxidoreductase subunit L
MGIGAYSAGVFHLVTHAYFKALLFLGAGSVIHALKGEQNVLQMGGLKNYIVGTTVVFGAGYLAIIGIPPFSGWWSKDQILYHAYLSGETHLFVLAVLAALLTTFYMTRLFCLVFIGTPRLSKQKIRDVHESPLSMLAPMGVLAVLAFFGGFFPLSVEPALKAVLPGAHKGAHGAGLSEGKFAFYLTLAVVFVSVATFYMYTAWKKKLENIALRCSNASLILERQYRYDDALVWLASRGSSGLAEVLRWFDVYVIDGLVNGVGGASRSFGTWIGRLQNGLAQSYAFFIVVGSIVMVVLLLRNLS